MFGSNAPGRVRVNPDAITIKGIRQGLLVTLTEEDRVDRELLRTRRQVLEHRNDVARQIKSKRPESVAVFVLPPSLPVLLERLRGRATDSEETVLRRFRVARSEIAHYGMFDYVLVNDDLDEAVDKLVAIVLAEECRRRRAAPLAEELLEADWSADGHDS